MFSELRPTVHGRSEGIGTRSALLRSLEPLCDGQHEFTILFVGSVSWLSTRITISATQILVEASGRQSLSSQMSNWCQHLRTRFDAGVGGVGTPSTELGLCYV